MKKETKEAIIKGLLTRLEDVNYMINKNTDEYNQQQLLAEYRKICVDLEKAKNLKTED